MAFTDLPIELVQQIALALYSDTDICSFAAVCHNTRDAVYLDGDSFWFRRFKLVYDPVRGARRLKGNAEYRELYQDRVKYMRDATSQKQILKSWKSKSRFLKNWQGVLVGMIEDATPSVKNDEGQTISKNAQIVIRHALESGLMNNVLRYPTQQNGGKGIPILQLLLSHMMFELHGPSRAPLSDTYNFAESQKIVYDATTQQPVFRDRAKQQVNIEYALNCINFFKHHLTREEEHTAYPEYAALAKKDRPAAWQPQAEEDVGKLGRKWIGTYTYLEHNELRIIRRDPRRDEIFFQDKHIDEGHHVLQNMDIDFVKEGEEHFYPELFDMILNPGSYSNSQAQHRPKLLAAKDQKLRFTGFGEDEEKFATTGFLTALPPQDGVPGFCRVVMMKYFVQEDDMTVATDSLWAYEGLVLPGGKIMVGRWWAADAGTRANEQYSGPFIFWNVPDEPEPQPVVNLVTMAGETVNTTVLESDALSELASTLDNDDSGNDREDEALGLDSEGMFDEDLEEDTLQADIEARQNSVERFNRYFDNQPTDPIKPKLLPALHTGKPMPAANTPKTPTTPLVGMSLDDPIDLTSPEGNSLSRSSRKAFSSFKATDRADSPLTGIFTPPRPAHSPLFGPYDAIFEPNLEAIWNSQSVSDNAQVSNTFFTRNTLDHLGVSSGHRGENHVTESPHLNNKQRYNLLVETTQSNGKPMPAAEGVRYAGLLSDPWGYGGAAANEGGRCAKRLRRH